MAIIIFIEPTPKVIRPTVTGTSDFKSAHNIDPLTVMALPKDLKKFSPTL
jgi:hypothetical protein